MERDCGVSRDFFFCSVLLLTNASNNKGYLFIGRADPVRERLIMYIEGMTEVG